MPKVVVKSLECMLGFKCDRKNCKDRCCNKFDAIYFTADSYNKIINCGNIDLEAKAKENIKLNEESNTDYEQYVLRPMGKCQLLGEDGECLIKSNLGADCMGHPCGQYPKKYLNITGKLEASVFPLCSVALRKILSQKDGIKTIPLQREISKKMAGEKYTDVFGAYTNFIEKLRELMLQWLQDRRFRIAGRLLMLETIFNHLDQLFQVHDPKRSDFLKLYQEGLSELECEATISRFKSNFREQFALCYILCDLLVISGADDELSRLLSFIEEFAEGLEGNITLCAEKYKQAYEEFYKPFEQSNNHVFENLLVSEAINEGMPFLRFKRLRDSVIYLIVYFSLLRFILCMKAVKEEKLEQSHMFELIDCLVLRFAKNEADYEHEYDGIMTKLKLIQIWEKLKQFDLEPIKLINGLLGHIDSTNPLGTGEGGVG